MALSREDMLRELELLPVWRLREAPISQEAAASDESRVKEIAEVAQPQSAKTIEPSEPVLPVADDQTGAMPVSEIASESLDDRRVRIRNLDWPDLKRCVQDCTACELAATRTQTVLGVGDLQADWLFIGEAPGAEEDRKGEPFVGQAGKLLDNMLAAIGLRRGQNAYIANIVKCRPPGNRDPHPQEIEQCAPFLERQLALIQPKLIMTLGRVAAQTLLETDETIGTLRGKVHRHQGIPVIVTYHPAYLLRNLPDKAKAWEDLCLAKRTMQKMADVNPEETK
jgi:uracil-DNA glycosylase family 4